MDAGGPSKKSEESLAKKRARDRRAQQNQRNKRNEQVRSLQEQLTRMESRMVQLGRECEGLRHENKQLRARQHAVAQLVTTWGTTNTNTNTTTGSSDHAQAASADADIERGVVGLGLGGPDVADGSMDVKERSSSPASSDGTEQQQQQQQQQQQIPNLQFWSQWSGINAANTSSNNTTANNANNATASTAYTSTSPNTAASTASTTSPAAAYAASAASSTASGPWSNIPAHSASDVIVTESFKEWLERPELVQQSPAIPQPTELLYGSKSNFLANVINHSLRAWPCRDPERLAAGWLVYNHIKWMLQPSPENYARLQDFQVPVPEQLSHAHPYFVDFVFWPELRARMIQHCDTYNPQDVLGMFLCCVKLRWPWGQNFLEPEEDGTLRMRQDFCKVITSLDGWGLTDDFIQRFPLLMQGLNLNAIRYRVY